MKLRTNLDAIEYMDAIKNGDMEKVQQMVIDRAEKMGFKDAIPEQGNGYKIRTTRPPKRTKTYYKCFYVDDKGRPSALFVDNNAALPTNVWLSANDTYHFTAKNGNMYVPTMGNATNKDAGKTGVSIDIPDEKTRAELIKNGYLPEGKERGKMFKEFPPSRIYVFSGRVAPAMNGEFDKYPSSAIAYAWFVYDKGFKGNPSVFWI